MCGNFISNAIEGVGNAVTKVLDGTLGTGGVVDRVVTSDTWNNTAEVVAQGTVAAVVVAGTAGALGPGAGAAGAGTSGAAGAGTAGAGAGVAGAGGGAVAGAGTTATSGFSLGSVVGGVKTASNIVGTVATLDKLANGGKSSPVVPTANFSTGSVVGTPAGTVALSAQGAPVPLATAAPSGAGAAVVAQSSEVNYLPLIAAGAGLLMLAKKG